MNPKTLFVITAAVTALCAARAEETWPAEKNDMWHGFKRHNLTVDGCQAWVVEPKRAAAGNPGTWCMEFPGAFTERTGVLQMVEKGFRPQTNRRRIVVETRQPGSQVAIRTQSV